MKKLISLGKAVKDLHQKKISKSYFLCGNDIFMQDFFIQEFQKINPNTQSYLYYIGYDQQDSIFNELSNLSLFDSSKIIIIKNINRFSNKSKSELIDYLDQAESNNYVILVKNNFDQKNKFIDSILKRSTSIDVRTPFENKMIEWISYFLKLEKISISKEEIKYYVESYGNNIANVINYIRIDFLSNNNSTKDSNRTYYLWHFQDSLSNKMLNQSINIYKSLITNGNSENLILIYLFNLYYYLYNFICFNNNDFHNTFMVNKIIQSRINIYSQKYSQKEIENIILEIKKIDFFSKNTSLNTRNQMLCLISNICTGYYDR